MVNIDESFSQKVLEKYKNYYNPTLGRVLKLSGYDSVEVKAKGVYIYDNKGNKFLDCAAGYGVFNIGHCHPRVVRVAKDQIGILPLSSKVFLNDKLADLAEMLAEITPGNLKYSFFCNSGTEAVEGALKLARITTGKTEIISACGAFHGKTLGSLSASGREIFKKPFEPLIPEFRQVEFGNIDSIKEAVSDKTAAVILEPIQGEGGVNLPPENYLKEVEHFCKNNNILFVLDEIQTGFGRCGELFASNIYNLEPDILIIAKALGGGIMPIGAFIGTEKVWEPFKKSPLLHTSTFGGNPLACVCAIETINVIHDEKLSENAKIIGEYLIKGLKKVQTKFPEIVKEVRGKGLFIGIEMVLDGYAGALIFEFVKNKVLGVYTLNMPKVIRIEPPLIISKTHANIIIKTFSKGLEKVKKMFFKEAIIS